MNDCWFSEAGFDTAAYVTSQQMLSIEILGQLTWSNAKRFHRLPDIIDRVSSQRLVTGCSRLYSAPKNYPCYLHKYAISGSTWMNSRSPSLSARLRFQLTVGFLHVKF